jgi:hypothetical protein
MPPVGSETTIPASAWPQTYALDRVATGIGHTEISRFRIAIKHDILHILYTFLVGGRGGGISRAITLKLVLPNDMQLLC